MITVMQMMQSMSSMAVISWAPKWSWNTLEARAVITGVEDRVGIAGDLGLTSMDHLRARNTE